MKRFFAALGILSLRQKVWLLVMMAVVLIAAAMETVSIGLIMPFVQIVSDPGLVHRNAWLARGYAFLGARDDGDFLLRSAGALAAVFLLRTLFLMMVMRLRQSFLYRLYADIGERLFRSYLEQPFQFHLRKNSAELTRALYSDVMRFCTGVVEPLVQVVTELLMVAFLVTLLVSLRPLETFLTIGTFCGAAALIYFLVRPRLDRLGHDSQQTSGAMIQWINQGVASIRESTVAGCRDYFLRHYSLNTRLFAETQSRVTIFQEVPRLTFELAAMLTVILLVVTAAVRDGSAVSIVPFLAVFAGATTRIIPSISRIYGSMVRLRFSAPAMSAVIADFEEARLNGIDVMVDSARPIMAQPAEPLPFTRGIAINNLCFTFDGAPKPTIQDFSLFIPKGASIGIVGPSGAGKSTLLAILLGLLTPASGSVMVDDRDALVELARWRALFGYIPQDIVLIDDTIRANIAFGSDDALIDDKRVAQALSMARLGDFVAALEEGVATMVGERGVRLSGGQKQRVAIARALYRDPEILIMDEATASLDNLTEKEIADEISSLAGSKTMIIVAHRLTTIEHCDKIVFIYDGRIEAIGTFSELNTNERFRKTVLAEIH